MGLLKSLFGKKAKEEASSLRQVAEQTKRELTEQDRKFNRELSILQRADEAYKADNDLEKVIRAYRSVLDSCEWNAFNYQIKLANYYVKAGKYDEAWSMLSKAHHDAVKRGHGPSCTGQIRLEQFKVLKAQGKYKQALEILCRAYVVNNAPYGTWSRDSFIRHAKTCAKKLGLTEQRLESLADLVGNAIQKKDKSETNIRQAVSAFFKQ